MDRGGKGILIGGANDFQVCNGLRLTPQHNIENHISVNGYNGYDLICLPIRRNMPMDITELSLVLLVMTCRRLPGKTCT